MNSKLFTAFKLPLFISKRFTKKKVLIKKNLHNWHDDGIQYDGFKYYPRDPTTFEDPPYEPSKLFRVQRIKPVKGTPYYERRVLQEFGLIDRIADISILKNTPEINAKLWRIKHLVRITPITFPNGVPTDTMGTFLKENGELLVSEFIKPLENRTEASEHFEKDPIKLNGDVIRRQLRYKWNRGQ